MRRPGIMVIILFCLTYVLPSLALGPERVQVKMDTTEAEQVLAILAKRKQAQPVTDADWLALFATEPYRRLGMREAAMHRAFTD